MFATLPSTLAGAEQKGSSSSASGASTATATTAKSRRGQATTTLPLQYSGELAVRTQQFDAACDEKGRRLEALAETEQAMQARGEGRVLDQFANPDNPLAHYESTGPEIWEETGGAITHLVSSMGTTGSIMGCSQFFKEKNPEIQIVGLQPTDGASIPGIRRWPEAYLPSIFDAARVDRVIDMGQDLAERTMRRLAREEGIFCGVSSGGSVAAALQLSEELENAVIVAIVCDRGDRYLSTGVFNAEAGQ